VRAVDGQAVVLVRRVDGAQAVPHAHHRTVVIDESRLAVPATD